jgi:tetratricopeptide (TPR) repeat protein
MNSWKMLIALAVTGALFGPLPAQADEGEASRLFREGRAAMNAGDYETALDRLTKSQKADPSPGTVLNLAICEHKLGRLLRARKHIRGVLEALPPTDPRRPVAEKHAKEIEAGIPYLAILLGPEAPDVRVTLNGRHLKAAELGKPMPLDPGVHLVTFSSAGGRETRRVELREGQRSEVPFASPGGPDSESAQVTPSTAAPGGTSPTLGYVLLGVGAVGVGAGSYLWLHLGNKQETVDANCDSQKRCNDAGLEAAEDGQALLPLYTGAWIVGAAGLAAGAYFLLDSSTSDDSAPRVSGAPLPGGGSLGLSGRF